MTIDPIDPGDALTRVRDTKPPGERPTGAAHGTAAVAREPGALSPAAALRWLGVAVAFAVLSYTLALELEPSVIQHVPMQLPPRALESNAGDGLRRLGIPAVAHAAGGLDYDGDVLRHLVHREGGRDRWENLRTGQPAAVFYWHRESPRPLLSTTRLGVASESDPPLTEPGAVRIRLDTAGRLIFLQRVAPRDVVPLLARREPDWARLFGEAGLDLKRFRKIEALFVPPVFGDSRASWIGSYASRPEIRIRVDAAALHGRPVYFELLGPWSLEPLRGFDVIGWELAVVSLLVAGLVLARRNLRLGRGDRRGALRLGAAAFLLVMLQWLFQAGHVREALLEWSLLQRGVAWALFWSGSVALCYVAIEPYVRRFWPEALDSWSLLLAGGLRAPRVGRDVLIGLAAGYAMLVLAFLTLVSPATFGSQAVRLASLADPSALVGWPQLLGGLCEVARLALYGGFAAMTLLLLLRVALPRPPLAAVAYVVLVTLAGLGLLQLWLGDSYLLDPLLIGATQLVAHALLTRLGLVAMIAGLVPVAFGLAVPLVGGNWSAWYAPSLLLPVVVQAGLLAYAFLAALGGRPVVSDDALR